MYSKEDTIVTLQPFLKEELLKLNSVCKDQADIFEMVYKEAFGKGYVSENFLAKIKEREASFPTGLQIGDYSVAIPHTDPEHVFEQFISVVTLQKPVSFYLMDDNTKKVDVRIVLLLGLNQPHTQLTVLQELMQTIQDQQKIEQLLQAENQRNVQAIFNGVENISTKGEK